MSGYNYGSYGSGGNAGGAGQGQGSSGSYGQVRAHLGMTRGRLAPKAAVQAWGKLPRLELSPARPI